MMPDSGTRRRWDDAVGVLPLETVLAQEHEFVHGDATTAQVAAVGVQFTVGQVIDPVAFTTRLLRAWQVLAIARGRPSRSIDFRAPLLDQPPLDAVADYVIRTIPADRLPAVEAALDACSLARSNMDARAETSDSADHAELPTSPVRTADALLISAIVPHLNALLTVRLDEEPAFRPFVDQGAVAALGSRTDATEPMANRLLIEAGFHGQLCRLQDVRLDVVYDAVRQRDTTALCLSGGGIRSATFANGVLRGLAKHGLLGRFDYLSTVSGGGYAGSWLSAWMHHAGAPEVQQQLGSAGHDKLAPEPPPMQHLRAFSHFLTPRMGAFSTDTWTLAATIGRNMMFNWAVLLPLMAAALLVPRFILALVRVDYCDVWPFFRPSAMGVLWSMYGVGVLLLTYGLRYLHRNRPVLEGDEDDAGLRRARAGMQSDFIQRCFVPLTAAAVLLTLQFYLWWSWQADVGADYAQRCVDGAVRVLPLVGIDPVTQVPSVMGTLMLHGRLALVLIGLGGLSHLAGWALSGRLRRHSHEWALALISGSAAGAAALVMVVWFVTQPDTLGRDTVYTTLAPPALLAVLLLGSQLFTALSSRYAGDAEREWVARFNAWLLIAIVMWIGACILVLYGPTWVAEGWAKLTLLAVGGGSGLLGVLIARSGSSSSVAPPPGLVSLAKKAALALAAPLFAAAIVIGLAASNESLIAKSCSLPGISRFLDCRARTVNRDDLSNSQPFLVRARHMTADLHVMGERLASTGADDSLAKVFVRGAARALHDSVRGNWSGVHWDSAVHELHRQAVERVALTTAADRDLRRNMQQFVAAALAIDSAITGAIGGDPFKRDSLLQGRVTAVRRAGAVVHQRRLGRDAAATAMDSNLTRIIALQRGAAVSSGVARADTLEALREIVDLRLGSSIELFRSIRADSGMLSASMDGVQRAIGEAAVAPYDGAVPATIIIIFGALVLLGLFFGYQIDTNKFSLRAMYEMRLVRAYLGASRPAAERRPNPFTGFDPRDDIPMGQLWPNWGRTQRKEPGMSEGTGRSPSSPPFHVVNTTLNLVAGANLAWQQRKAESMTISPLHAGSAFVGYRATSSDAIPHGADGAKGQLYGGEHGVTLGTAVTISGAAASPNSGSLSSPVATFLMTFFNARLGAWLGNPGSAGAKTYHLATPSQIVRPILAEMFGMTTDRSPYVALSDGGHFENLALYEMVLRRCRLIVVSDAGCDPNAAFDDLGNAVRKIRIDLGVPIEFPDGVHIHARNDRPATGGDYWAVGRIRYSAVDHSADAAHTDGVLIYIKPALYGREPSDVQQYSRMSDTFPHESTADQFFSESQFESYRELGEFIVTKLVGGPFSTQLNIASNNADSLLVHWADLSKAVVTTSHTILTEGSAWPTSAEKRTD